MTSTLFSIGLSGLKSSQIALNTTSNNISNAYTDGYNRQITNLSQSATGVGVSVSGVERQYQQYLNTQLNQAQSTGSALDSQLAQLTQVDNLLADSDVGLSPLMQQFFSGLQTVADAPSDTAARQSLLGDAETMTAQFRSISDYLSNMGASVESQMGTAVDQINNYADQIAKLNKQISLTEAKTGETSNTLRDQRDQMVTELSKLTNITMTVQDGKDYNISVAGNVLVSGSDSYSLTMKASDEDPSRQVVAYVDSAGNTSEIKEAKLTGGTLGGLVQFRKDSLEPLQNKIGQLTVSLAGAVNAQHEEGYDLDGQQGSALFSFGDPVTVANAKNSGSGDVTASFVDGSDYASEVTASNYRVTYQDGSYSVERLTDGNKTTVDVDDLPTDDSGNPYLDVDGVRLTLSGTPEDGDSFLVKPTANAASSFAVEISDPAKIAASGEPGATTDNSNALALADLQNQKIVSGNASFNSAYAQIVSVVGNQTSTVSANSESQTNLVNQLTIAQQSVSGVNLDEEAANLLRYQQLYAANAQVISTASSMFDTLLGIVS